MFLFAMSHEVTIPTPPGIDWKAVGYLFSILSTFLLGAAAWPKENAPGWYHPVLVVGVITALIGFGLRYMAHLKQRGEIEQAKAEAADADGKSRSAI